MFLNKLWTRIKKTLGFKEKTKPLEIIYGSKSELDSSSNTDEAFYKPPATEQVKEQAWFTRANDLVNEFYYEPTPVYGSAFGSYDDAKPPEPIGWLQADGSITQNKKGGLLVRSEEEELLHDDVEFLKKDPNYVKPNLEKSKTVNFNDYVQNNTQGTGDNKIENKASD